MKPRPSLRRVFKWSGVAVSAALVGLWVSSIWWAPSLTVGQGSDWRVGCSSTRGAVTTYWEVGLAQRRSGFTVELENQSAASREAKLGVPLPMVWWPEWATREWTPTMGHYILLRLPYWMLLGVPAFGTASILWRDARRFGPGRCSACGYDLSGLPPGAACPECGKAA